MAALLTTLEQALTEPNVAAFLMLIRVGEGTADEAGYRRYFGGGLFDSYADHPRKKHRYRIGRRYVTSSAAGAYQIIEPTWDMVQGHLHLPDFTPHSQDLAAVWLIRRRRALNAVIAGDLNTAIRRCAREWASLPGSPYGQPVLTLSAARQAFIYAGGRIAQEENRYA